ncbi:hypothetical protein CIHG_02239 [Coccidioides immitis H538.4]|uniref:Uncharacterized protein n=1 Tax=Coccidioides immitis H538.4 TaxID=396776 RepID=A0A0J8RKI1_COCIT|nr:hypothetical protein CIHG_02239 [Coccidioides immitis H538.4]
MPPAVLWCGCPSEFCVRGTAGTAHAAGALFGGSLAIPVAIRYQKFGRSPPTGGLAVIYVTLIVHTENPYPINSGLVVTSTTARGPPRVAAILGWECQPYHNHRSQSLLNKAPPSPVHIAFGMRSF